MNTPQKTFFITNKERCCYEVQKATADSSESILSPVGSTCFYEFQKTTALSCWQDDSIYISDDDFEEYLLSPISKVREDFDPWGVTTITKEDWQRVAEFIPHDNPQAQQAYQEANEWVTEVFKEFNDFTIFGM